MGTRPGWMVLAAVAAAYLAAAKLGLALAFSVPQVTLVWAPAGIALAAARIWGPRVWPAVALAAFVANVTTEEPAGTALAIAAGNTLEALAGAWLLRRLDYRRRLARLRDAAALLAAAAASPVIAATVGSLSLVAGGVQPAALALQVWGSWWLGDAMGMLVVAPFLLTWSLGPWRRWSPATVAETLGVAGAAAGIGVAVFLTTPGPPAAISAVAYLVFPVVIWAALRPGPPATSLAVLVAAALAVAGTIRGSGPFARPDRQEGLLLLLVFIATLAVTGLVLAAVTAERARMRREEVALRTTGRLLAAAAPLSQVTPALVRELCEGLDWDVGTIWRPRPAEDRLRCEGIAAGPSPRLRPFIQETETRAFQRGEGLPGRVWQGGEAAWIEDVRTDGNFPRAPTARRCGIRSGVCFPIRVGGTIEAIVELFSRQVEERDAGVLELLEALAVQVGQFVERGRTEAEVARLNRALARRVEELEGVLDIVPFGIAMARDAECREIAANPAFERMLGIGRGTNASKTGPDADRLPFRVLRDGHEVAPHDLPMQQAAARGEAVRGIELAFVHDAGTVIQVVAHALPLFDEAGRARGSLGAFVDVTERKRLEDELRGRIGELREVDRRKDEFLAMLAHELRNPLAPIWTAAEVLRPAVASSPSAQRARDVIDRQVRHMVKLIDDLLDVSRVTRGKVQLDRSVVELRPIVDQAIELNRELVEAGRHALEVELPAEPLWLDADPTRLTQVVSNLLNNAAKFSGSGAAIRISAGREGDEVVLHVRDEGRGIEPDRIPLLFDLFVQGERTPDRGSGGLGVGLTLVKTLVEMHGGSVAGASAGPGTGTTFTVRLPAYRGAAPAAAVEPAPAASVRPLRVLVVEDNADAAEMLLALLRDRGHEAHGASDGRSGLDEARRLVPDLVLLDLGLPELDGFEVARRLRSELAGRLRIVAVTGYGQPDDRRRSREAGFDGHLVKPVSGDDLDRLLAQVAG